MPLAFELAEDEIDYKLFDIIIVGHIHNRISRYQNGCLILYPGSVTRCSIAEARDEKKNGKGYIILDLDDNLIDVTHHNIPMPREFIELTINTEQDVEKIKHIDSENKPLLFINGNGDINIVNKIYDKIESVADDYLHIKVNFNTKDSNDDGYEATDEIMDARTLLRTHVEKEYDKPTADLSINLLGVLGHGAKDDMVLAQDILDTFFEGFQEEVRKQRENRSWEELTSDERDIEISLLIDYSKWDRPFFEKTGRFIYSFTQTYSPFDRCYAELVGFDQPYNIISVDEYRMIMGL